MILNKSNRETDSFLDINNDITRIINKLNESQELKKLLTITTKKPLEHADITADLRDKQIGRQPILPYDEEEGSIIVVTLLSATKDASADTMYPILAIDIFTPGNQWIINEGIRPLQIAHAISNIMLNEFKQTGGVRYRCEEIANAQLTDVLVGYRMFFNTVIDD